jgi:putative ABC transport system substrate-binding protein
MGSCRRRQFFGMVGALLAATVARAQDAGRVWRVGHLSTRQLASKSYFAEFEQAMRDLGYVEGRNLRTEWRFAEGDTSRLPALAAELIGAKVDVIVTAGTPPSKAAQRVTTTVPIVFASVGDPVGVGLVKSLARPEANITGVSNQNVEIVTKRLGIILTALPRLARVALLMHPDNPNHRIALDSLRAEGERRGIDVLSVRARTPQEIESAFEQMRRDKAGAVLVSLDGLFQEQRMQIAELANKHRLPSMTADPVYADAGCLISYGTRQSELQRRAAWYVDRILKGAKPGDLPVEQPTNYDLTINVRTAKAIGVRIPKELLLRADRVIE